MTSRIQAEVTVCVPVLRWSFVLEILWISN